MSKAKHNVISYKKLDIKCINLKPVEDNERIPSQKLSYPAYNDPKKGEAHFNIQTPEIKLDNYGIPNEGPYYQTDKARAFIKIPLGVNENTDNETKEERSKREKELLRFKKALEQIDEYVVENKNTIFGSEKAAKKFTYQPIVRDAYVPENDSDDSSDEENDKPVISRPQYMKVKIPLDYGTNEVNLEVYKYNTEGTTDFENDGKYSKIEGITHIDELKKYVRYMSTVKLVLHACKLWASKQPSAGDNKKKYGIVFKVRRVVVKLRDRVVVDDEDSDVLVESSDEDEELEVKHFVEKTAESASSDESEEDVVKKKTKKTRSKKSKN